MSARSVLQDGARILADASRQLADAVTGRRSLMEHLRGMYASGEGNPAAKSYARLWAWAYARRVAPTRWVTLEVPGRSSGRITKFPLGMADLDGHWYLVSMLAGECNWVRNVEAAHRTVRLVGRWGDRAARLHLVPVSERPPVLRRYLAVVPGGRPHIPVDQASTDEEVADVAARHSVYRVELLPDRPSADDSAAP